MGTNRPVTWRKAPALAAGSISALLLLGACGSDEPTTAGSEEPAGTAAATGGATGVPASPSSAAGENGELFTTQFQSGTNTLKRYPIAADGSLGTPVVVLEGPGTDSSFPAVIDSRAGTVLTGSMTDYWSTNLQRRNLDGAELSALAVDSWCGGEGAASALCVLVDDDHVARTTSIGPELGEGKVIVASLADGSQVAEYGPFPGFTNMLPTTTPGQLLLATTTNKEDEGNPNVPGTIVALTTSTGQTTDVAEFPESWLPLCAVGTDGVLGQRQTKSGLELVGVGSATVGDGVKLSADDSLVGCSADGAFVYVQNILQPPTGENDDEPAGGDTAVERISVADGTRTTVATVPQGEWVGPIAR